MFSKFAWKYNYDASSFSGRRFFSRCIQLPPLLNLYDFSSLSDYYL